MDQLPMIYAMYDMNLGCLLWYLAQDGMVCGPFGSEQEAAEAVSGTKLPPSKSEGDDLPSGP